MQQTQLLKGVLEGCALLIISEKETYGYEMVNRLRAAGFKDIIGGTVYPLLQKLEKNGLLSSIMKPSSDGPDRKYYQITPIGKAHYEAFKIQWALFSRNVDNVIKNHEELIENGRVE